MEKFENKSSLTILDLPILDYKIAWDFQKTLHYYRVQDLIPDTLLLLEHLPTITLGKFGKEENLLKPKEEIEKLNISFHRVDRGGDITYHGPGQLVGYFIFKIESIKKLIYSIENSIIELLKDYGIEGKIIDKYPGVWVEDKKICALGMAVKKKVSYHGFALNVNNDLTPFSYIIPCGLKDKRVTSIYTETKTSFPLKEIKIRYSEIFPRFYSFSKITVMEVSDDREVQNFEKLLEVLRSL